MGPTGPRGAAPLNPSITQKGGHQARLFFRLVMTGKSADDRVQRGRGAHDRCCFDRVIVVIAARIDRLSPARVQFGQNGGFLCGQLCRDGREMRGQVGIVRLRGQGFGPVAREPVMAVAVVRLACLATGRAVIVQHALRRHFHRVAQDPRFRVALGIG